MFVSLYSMTAPSLPQPSLLSLVLHVHGLNIDKLCKALYITTTDTVHRNGAYTYSGVSWVCNLRVTYSSLNLSIDLSIKESAALFSFIFLSSSFNLSLYLQINLLSLSFSLRRTTCFKVPCFPYNFALTYIY